MKPNSLFFRIISKTIYTRTKFVHKLLSNTKFLSVDILKSIYNASKIRYILILRLCIIRTDSIAFVNKSGGSEKSHFMCDFNVKPKSIYFELVYLVTAFVPSLTACLANSPGNNRRTAV